MPHQTQIRQNRHHYQPKNPDLTSITTREYRETLVIRRSQR